jgi:hypothetical protein
MLKWHVMAYMPIMSLNEHKLGNPYEHYTYDNERDLVKVKFTSTPIDTQISQLAEMHGYIKNSIPSPSPSSWELNPKVYFYLPLKLKYIMLYVAEDYSWCLVGVPSRANCWIMTAKRPNNKDCIPWPSDCNNSSYKNQQGCQGISGAIVECDDNNDNIDKVFNGNGVDYTNNQSTLLTSEEEKNILQQGVLMAEKNGYDISQMRITCWRADIP